jgi:ABC-type polysaccharide/polyol phosphate export permease
MLAKLPGLDSMGAFTIYLCAGLLGWISFAECMTRGTNAFIENSTFLKKLPIPEHVFVAQVCLSSFFSAVISYSVMILIVLVLGFQITVTWLLVPVIIILFQMFGFGLALLFSTINVFFRDISQLMGIVTSIWMWLTPIVYAADILPTKFKNIIYYNPAYPFISSLQRSIVYHQWPLLSQWIMMLVITIVTIVLGYTVLSKLRKEIRDNL